jgi:hypothetical protein
MLERMPDDARGRFAGPPPIALALRSSGRRAEGLELSLLNASGEHEWYESGGVLTVSGDEYTYYWTVDPAFDRAVTLRIELVDGPFRMGPPQ